MADVRLTATNPEDSSVVPVACNEKGELKLEEIPDQSFDGNLQGNLTVSGSAAVKSLEAGSSVHDAVAGVNTSSFRRSHSGLNLDCFIQLPLVTDSNSPTGQSFIKATNKGEDKFNIGTDGSATFKGNVLLGAYEETKGLILRSVNQNTTSPKILASHTNSLGSGMLYEGNKWSSDQYQTVFSVDSEGAATFASNKAGFTKEGYLWCTTRRGDTVILDATSNGMGIWEPYTPPTRWSEKNVLRPKPEESSRDEPETTQ